MKRLVSLSGMALILGAVAMAPLEPLRVTAILPPKPHYLGQPIEIEVRVEAEGAPGPPTVVANRRTDADIRPLPIDPARPSIARFLLIPRRVGSMDLPAFRASLGDRSGSSNPVRLAITSVPADGRPSAFLGGVGPFEVRAEAEPSTIQLGQNLEYRIKVTGPAAWGCVRSPELVGKSWAAFGVRMEPMEDVDAGSEPPSRTFRYRLRPSKAGRLVLPPVAVAAFDPKTRRFETRTSASVPIVVKEPPRFDPSVIDYQPVASSDSRTRLAIPTLVLSLIVIAIASMGLWAVASRSRAVRRVDPRTLARGLARGLDAIDPALEEGEAARAVVEALTTFLEQVEGRAPGVLTPLEALDGFGRSTSDRELSQAAERLVVRCDRARYGRGGSDAIGLIAEGRGILERIAEVGAKHQSPGRQLRPR